MLGVGVFFFLALSFSLFPFSGSLYRVIVIPTGRLVRLVPEDPDRTAIKNLLNYRLPEDNDRARLEWYSIVEGTHALWRGV